MKDFIEQLGGSGFLANELGLKQSRVTMWRVNGVAWRFRPAVAKIARRKRISLPAGFLDPAQAGSALGADRPAEGGGDANAI